MSGVLPPPLPAEGKLFRFKKKPDPLLEKNTVNHEVIYQERVARSTDRPRVLRDLSFLPITDVRVRAVPNSYITRFISNLIRHPSIYFGVCLIG